MPLIVEQQGDVTVAAVNVEQFDASNADEFKREISPVLAETKKLVLDMSGVQFVDSRACGAILSCLKHLSEVGGDLKICNVHRFVATTFELIRLHRICEIVPTKEDAVRAFAAS
ncbi:MAG: STAS domain-containing protein [Gemmataceae bacterium]